MSETQGPAPASPEELRAAARTLEEQVIDPEALINLSFPNAIGDPQTFPREAAENRAALAGFAILEEERTRAVATLYALAEAEQRGLRLSPMLLAFVHPYVEAYRAARAAANDETGGQEEGEAQPTG